EGQWGSSHSSGMNTLQEANKLLRLALGYTASMQMATIGILFPTIWAKVGKPLRKPITSAEYSPHSQQASRDRCRAGGSSCRKSRATKWSRLFARSSPRQVLVLTTANGSVTITPSCSPQPPPHPQQEVVM